MLKTKKNFSFIITSIMVFCAVFAMRIPASAATCSNGIQTCTITVTTKANYAIPGSESITLKQTKGTCEQKTRGLFGKTKIKTSKQYGAWDIVAEAEGHTVKKRLTGASVKLKLKPNKTYNITVTWDSAAATFKTLSKGNYTTYPTWKVGSTWKVSEYF